MRKNDIRARVQQIWQNVFDIFAEPAGVASIAGLKRLLKEGVIGRDEEIVNVITGAVLKDVKSAMNIAGEPLS